MNDAKDNEISLNLLKLLKNNPELTQRQMNKEMGVSLGKINYYISELVKEGLIKIEKFKKTEKKSRYLYRLTPEGLEEIARLTLSFLSIRMNEYNRIKKEIKHLSEYISKIDPDFYNDSRLMEDLKKHKVDLYFK
ncbi:MAG: MarR family EPS-associated transcriptional regulator [Desulfobacula sp.]|uniref:MarR family EPS-associated transcriptional regulator n=1 Tax=Desulfobacula sp. TaxID=2593537 RepID=UPI0025BFC969|nr:MarR family EPS-associated transcriptional regulator [Desulfobacula sp.]MCD4718336.1 MarR family EPS-associated transcriptional regulator [Desulfobacula sp.]